MIGQFCSSAALISHYFSSLRGPLVFPTEICIALAIDNLYKPSSSFRSPFLKLSIRLTVHELPLSRLHNGGNLLFCGSIGELYCLLVIASVVTVWSFLHLADSIAQLHFLSLLASVHHYSGLSMTFIAPPLPGSSLCLINFG